MSRGGKGRPDGRGVVVLAGESRNDREIVAALVRGLYPALAKAVVLTQITDQVRLRKKTGADLDAAARALLGKARGLAKRKSGELVGFIVHEDMDAGPGPEYDHVRTAVSSALDKAAGGAGTAYALAAAESEAWLLLFPQAFPLHQPSWRIPDAWQGRDTGRRTKPKEDLAAEFTKPRFREADGPGIMKKALEHGLLTTPVGTNRSFAEFRANLRKWPVPAPRSR